MQETVNSHYNICWFLVPPMFWIPSQLEGAYVGQDVTIECHSEAFPHSINYWVKKDGVMLISSKYFMQDRIVLCSFNHLIQHTLIYIYYI